MRLLFLLCFVLSLPALDWYVGQDRYEFHAELKKSCDEVVEMGEHAYGIDEIIGVKWRIYGIFDDTDALMALVYRSLMIMDKEEARLLYERTMVYLADEVLGTPQEVEQSRAVWLIPDQNGYTYGLSLWYTDDGVYMMVAD
jgi:hypothetical protein